MYDVSNLTNFKLYTQLFIVIIFPFGPKNNV